MNMLKLSRPKEGAQGGAAAAAAAAGGFPTSSSAGASASGDEPIDSAIPAFAFSEQESSMPVSADDV
jgi:hypothetical protein